jgi:GTP:adenosylcobinamide-phosphate guanylyltransferase
MLNIIIQAGGRGSRLRHHTWNKPKCLVSVKGKPILYYMFDRFPNASFYIIGDYAFEQLEKYLLVNPPTVNYRLIKTDQKGTCSGIQEALKNIPQNEEILLAWSDLIINQDVNLSEEQKKYKRSIGITNAFTCRWTYNNQLEEKPGTNGVPGIFWFNDSTELKDVPTEGEFVKWWSKNISEFSTFNVDAIEELGDFSTIESQNDRLGFSRFFNNVTVNKSTVEKICIDKNYDHLILGEIDWYEKISSIGFRRIPKILSTDPLVMTRIVGWHPFDMNDLTEREKYAVMADCLDTLIDLHDKAKMPVIADDVIDVYVNKTKDRVYSINKLIPNFHSDSITINGLKCKNVFTEKNIGIFDEILKICMPLKFTPIHGDPTFSNMLVDKHLRTWLFDPRGYFKNKGIWGDPTYDYAKLYYSAVGGYDKFNRKKFKLHVDNETAEILMEEPLFCKAGQDTFKEFFSNNLKQIEILHGLIWLSLSGYAKDDIDSVIGSFYLGLYWLEKGLK